MGISEKKLELFDAHLSHKGLQHLVDVAASLLGNPIFMADMGMVVICKSSDMGEGPDDFSAENDFDRQMGLVNMAAQAGALEKIYHRDQPIIGEFEGHPRYLAARVRDGRQLLGHVVVTEAKRPFEADDEELLPVVCQTLAYELRRTRYDSPLSDGCKQVLNRLIADEMRDEEEARRRMASFGCELPQTVRLLVLRQVNPEKAISQSYLSSHLDRAFPGSASTFREGECVQVIDGAISLARVAERLRATAYLGGVVVGCSRAFKLVTLLGSAWRQADAAIRITGEAEPGAIIPYDSVALQHLLELATTSNVEKRASFASRELELLDQLDALDGTNYVETLAAYLNCGRNVASAAKALHMHKNSLYYRVQRIEETVGVDLSDEHTCFSLQLALALRGLGPKPADL